MWNYWRGDENIIAGLFPDQSHSPLSFYNRKIKKQLDPQEDPSRPKSTLFFVFDPLLEATNFTINNIILFVGFKSKVYPSHKAIQNKLPILPYLITVSYPTTSLSIQNPGTNTALQKILNPYRHYPISLTRPYTGTAAYHHDRVRIRFLPPYPPKHPDLPS